MYYSLAKWFTGGILAAVLTLSAVSWLAPGIFSGPSVDAMRDVVVKISHSKAHGTGTIISSDGVILTNKHVVKSAPNGTVKVQFRNGKTVIGKVLWVAKHADLATVKIMERTRRHAYLSCTSAQMKLRINERIMVIGHPANLRWVVTQGRVTGYDQKVGGITDTQIYSGNSGGPVFNMKGQLIGVVWGMYAVRIRQGFRSTLVPLGYGLFIPLRTVCKHFPKRIA